MTLHDELRRLEGRARQTPIAGGAAFSRSLLARESGVSESTLAAWIDQGRVPQDSGKLTAVGEVLSGWAGVAPADVPWQDLWVAARNEAAARKGKPGAGGGDGTAKKDKNWARRGLAVAASTAALALITGLFQLFAGDIHSRIPVIGSPSNSGAAQQSGSASDPSAGNRSSGGPASVEDFHAHANWCCQVVTVDTSTGFYWAGTPGSLDAALDPTRAGATIPTLMPGGVGLIEIPVQSSGTEPILVAPPRVIVRSRGPNIAKGMIAILPRGGQGGGSTGEFEADVDNAAPVTVPVAASGSGASSYQYVSANSAEVITLYVMDANYDCTFDIQLTWQEQGRSHITLLTNNGQHFRIVGSEGLPWYTGDPRMGTSLTPVPPGKPFSHYAA